MFSWNPLDLKAMRESVYSQGSGVSVFPMAMGYQPWGLPFYALGCVSAYSRVHKGGVLNSYYSIRKVSLWSEETLPDFLGSMRARPPAIFMLSSYVWNHELCLSFARQLKQISPQSLILIGGPNIPRSYGQDVIFLQNNPSIDIICRGEGELTAAELLEVLADQKWPESGGVDLSAVAGVTWRHHGDIMRNADRQRASDLSIFPSPYLTGEFDQWFVPKIRKDLVVILETNRGCPYGCTFCDWGAATLQKIKKFPMDKVLDEIRYVYHGPNRVSVFCADANFGVFDRDVEIAKYLSDFTKSRYGRSDFHATYTKNPNENLAKIVKILRSADLSKSGTISIQSRDKNVLSAIDRSNIKNEKYDLLIDLFNKEKMPLSSELIVGLPEQTYESYKNDLQFFVDRKINAQTYRVSIMPNAPMADPDYIRKYGIESDADNRVISTAAADRLDYQKMVTLFMAYQLMFSCSIGKYMGYFLQVDCGIKMMDWIELWLERSDAMADRYPVSAFVRKNMLNIHPDNADAMIIHWGEDAVFLFHNMDVFYREIIDMIHEKFGVMPHQSAFEVVVEIQKAVMPKPNDSTAVSLHIQHDYQSWYKQILDAVSIEDSKDFVPLHEFGEAVFSIAERKKKRKGMGFVRFHTFDNEWEIKNPLSLY